MGDLGGVLGSWVWPGQPLTIASSWGLNQKIEGLSLSHIFSSVSSHKILINYEECESHFVVKPAVMSWFCYVWFVLKCPSFWEISTICKTGWPPILQWFTERGAC